MTATRLAPLGLIVTLAAAGCGQSRGTAVDTGTVTMPLADGTPVTVEVRVCIRCHGDVANATAPSTDAAGIQFAPPVDVNRATSGPKVGAHMVHLRKRTTTTPPPLRAAGVDCSSCHVVPAQATQHVLGVNFSGLASTSWPGTPAITPAYAGGTCTSTYCHGAFPGGKAASIAWTDGTPACGTCHGFPPQAPQAPAHPNATNCGSCHPGYVGVGGINLDKHVDGTLDVACVGCHGTAGRTPNTIPGVAASAFDANLDAAPPVDHLGSSTGVLVGVHLAHVNPTASTAGAAQPTGGVYKPIACSECHPSYTSPTHRNGLPDVTFAAGTAATLDGYAPSDTPSSGGTPATCSTYCHNGVGGGSVATWTWTGAAATCGSCHGFPPASHTTVAANATACNGCHDGTVNADGTINIAGGLHIDGVVEGGESTGGVACGDCHSSIVTAMTGAPVGSASKHQLTLDTATDDSAAWTGTTLDGSVAVGSRSCVNMCHSDHPHDVPGTSTSHEYNLYADASDQTTRAASATATTTSRAKTDFDPVGNTGLCVTCHDTPISVVGGPTVTAATYGASAHDFTQWPVATPTWTWQYTLHSGVFARNCTKCHASAAEGTRPAATAVGSSAGAVHFNSNPSLLAGAVTPIATGNVCYNCHGSAVAPTAGNQGNRSGKDVQTQIGKANSHGTVGSCLDCHDPHEAKAGLHTVGTANGNRAGPAINGAAGARLTASLTLWQAPVAGSFTATKIASGSDLEATLCFKCHTAFGGTLPATTPATDVALEFNPNNRSGHPVLASLNNFGGSTAPKPLIAGQMTAAWASVGTQTMTCSDCHNTDAASPAAQGPHGSAVQFMLKGANAANWPNVTSFASSWCANCHNDADVHGADGAHQTQCYKCHIVVPHGGKLSRLICDNNSTMPTAYAFSGTLSNCFIQSFTKNTATNYSRSNCQSGSTGCSGEHGGAATENW